MAREEDTQTAAQRPLGLEGRPNANFRLVGIEGPDKGKQFAMPGSTAARVLIGTSSACTFRLTDPLVSRRHAALEVQGPALAITDLESRNGTYANDVAVIQALLWGGETLRIGDSAFRVQLDEGVVETKLSDRGNFGRLVGNSIEMRRLYPFFEQLAASNLPVLIEGETGTGKEVLAEALHENGPRAGAPFIVFDAALASSLIETTLFGDNANDKPGIFELADGGTVLLDEVGELDAQVQRKLLRVLERAEVQRVGAAAPRKVDVRILASTRLDLDRLVQDGAFREDLYYRLVVSRVELPPLRRRDGDIVVLSRHFWKELGGSNGPPEALLAQLRRLTWPGNVRELRNRIARVIAFGDRADPITPLPAPIPESPSIPPPPGGGASSASDHFERVLSKDLPLARARELLVAEFERAYVERVLAAHGGNVARAAIASGLARRYFQLLRAKRSPRT